MLHGNVGDAAVTAVSKRRNWLKGAGIGAAALALGGIGLPARRAEAQALTDVDILNFALNLEYLEAEFYVHATTGQSLGINQITGTGRQGGVTGGSKVPFKDKHIMQYAQEIARDEVHHVLFLRSALGSAAVARPQIDLDTSFTVLARAAGLVGPSGTFSPFTDDNSFLLGSFIFEDVCVTAYHGAAAAISSPDVLTAAAGILAVEAYHASAIRVKLLEAGLAAPVAKISALRRALSGANDDMGITTGNGVPNIVPADANGLAFARTPAQVLNIVYGGGAANNFLFFPNKLNGAIA
jgi:Ferritin-like domain